MHIPEDVRRALDEACRLAPQMRGFDVRESDPLIQTDLQGRVVVTLPTAASDVVDAWITLCRTKTGGTVSTNTSTRTITFRPQNRKS